MERERRAVIDVGSNSVKLLVADVCPPVITPVFETSKQTRLGQGLYQSNSIRSEAITETAQAVGHFAARARELNAGSIRVFATAAAREAANQEGLVQAIDAASGLKVEIISGEQEAEWVFQGVSTDPKFDGRPLLIMDVGGGSTEIILGAGGHCSFRHSIPLGSLRLLESLRPGDPPSSADLASCQEWLRTFMERHLVAQLESVLSPDKATRPLLVGTGGTATILARIELHMDSYDREAIESVRLGRKKVVDRMKQLWSVPLNERKKIVGLPANRADVIIMGVAIYDAIMSHFHLEEVQISTRGLRFGALLSP